MPCEDARDQEAQRVHCFALQSNSSRFSLLLTLFQVCPPGALAFPQQHFDLDTIVAMTKMSQRQFVRVARQTQDRTALSDFCATRSPPPAPLLLSRLRSPGSNSKKVKEVASGCRTSLWLWPPHILKAHSRGESNYISPGRNKKKTI